MKASRQLRWGLLSTARINNRIIDAVRLSTRSEVRTVGSRDRKRAAEYASEHGIPGSGTYEDILSSPDVDVIYISLPNSLHAEWGIRAGAQGKHALIEKPIAVTRQEVLDLKSAARAAGVVIQEASMMRFHPQTALLQDLVTQGAIGSPRWAQGSFSFTLRRREDIRWEQPGGGSIWDLGSYPVTLYQAVLRLKPIEVIGQMRAGESNVDMTFSAQIRYENDVFGLFVTSMEALPSWSVEFVGSSGRIRVTYPWLSHIGVESTLEVVQVGEASPSGTFGDGTDNQSVRTFSFPAINAYVDEVKAMESMILDGQPEVFPLDESAANIGVLAALLESAATSKRMLVDV